MASLPSYIAVPTSARIIRPPDLPEIKPNHPIAKKRTTSFPPSFSTDQNASTSKRFSIGGPSLPTSSITSNVSDLLLSSLLPTNLPKLPNEAGSGLRGGGGGAGKPRALSTQREGLRLDLMSNNFRRFITKVGPVFWLQDRIEEVLFWRKPIWTWTWMMIWAFISFKPRIILFAPFIGLMILLLQITETRNPLPSLLGTTQATTTVGTVRMSTSKSNDSTHSDTDKESVKGESNAGIGSGFSATTNPDGEVSPVVAPKEAESGVDYYLNLQAIQNTMGWVSDAYDEIYPLIVSLSSDQRPPTSLPLTATHMLLILLIPSLLLPLTPSSLVPYLLLPLGWGPPLFFHPNITPYLMTANRNKTLLQVQSGITDFMLNDALSNELGGKEIRKVEVWENERLDPTVSQAGLARPAPVSWSHKHLRAGERVPWVKVKEERSLWANVSSSPALDRDDVADKADGNGEGDAQMSILNLKEGWDFIPAEKWLVDICGLWSETGVDQDGWIYTDDSWQNPAPDPVLDQLQSETLPVRRVTRRRRWWKRVYRNTLL